MLLRSLSCRPVLIFLVGAVVLSLLLGGFFRLGDPDYFWHYKAGEYVVENHAVPTRDIFSFSMPDFPWVNHEWLSDTVLYLIESKAGQWWLGVFYFLLFLAALFILVRRKKGWNWLDTTVGLAGVVLLLSAVGVRQQTYSILFFAVLLAILDRYNPKTQVLQGPTLRKVGPCGGCWKFWLLPPLFLLWANLHGGFVLGLAALGFYAVWEFFQSDQKNGGRRRHLFLVAVISVLATPINHYGPRIYEEIFRTAGDSFLARHISEWQSFIFLPPVALRFAVFFAFLLVFLPEMRKRLALSRQIFILVLFLASLKSFKYLPYFIIAVLPAIWSVTDNFSAQAHVEHVKKIFKSKQIFLFGLAVAVVVSLFLYPNLIFKISYPAYPSAEAIEALGASGGRRVFNFYGWGGYLIRYAPNRRYFIDGRMPSWRTGETFAFGDYIDLTSCRRVDEVINKYQLDSVIWPVVPVEMRLTSWLGSSELDALSNRLSEKLFGKKSECNFLDELKSRGWEELFNDGNATLLLNKKIMP